MRSYEAMERVAEVITDDDLVVVTSTGFMKNEWYGQMPGDGTLFLPLLGGSLPFGLGMALALPRRRVVVLDSDGGVLFDPAPLCTIANELPSNLTAIVFDNEMYESIGRPPTHTSRNVDLERLADGAGIPFTATARDPEELSGLLSKMLSDEQPGLLVAKVEPGAYTRLPPDRVKKTDFIEDKYRFIRHVERVENIWIRRPYIQD